MVDDVFMDEIIDSIGEDREEKPKMQRCFICGELYDPEEGCCILD